MSITSSSSLASSRENSGPYLTWVRPALVLATGLGLLLPVILWASWMEPEGLLRFSPGWNNLFLGIAVAIFVTLLLLIPLVWMTLWRSLDVVGLTLAHQGLILLGYFFIERTAASLGVAELAAVQEGLPWIVMINLVGFSILLPVLAVTYAWDRKQGYRLKPLPAPAEDLDRKLIPFLRILAVILCGLIVLPMVMTGALPMIGGGEGEDVRYQMLSSSSSRPLYHFATGLVPVVAGALSVSILRRWRRFPLHDMVLLLLMAGLQVVSGNRLSLAIALFMTATLVTMQSRLPRWIFPPLYTLFLTFFMFLGGFSSLMRTDRERLREGDPFLTSLGEVYLGNNVIDLRDGAWVMGHWDFEPLLGQTYLGGLVAMAPSGLFPKKHDWHLGLTAVRLVGMDDRSHFGLRITFFGEAFLNFGWPGVAALAVLMGTLWATLLRAFHLILLDDPGCLTRNLQVVVLMQMCNPLTNTSDAFTFWTLLIFLVMLWLAVVRQARIADQRPGVL